MSLCFAGYRRNIRVGLDLISLEEEFRAMDMVRQYYDLFCPSSKKLYRQWTNLPRGFVFFHHGNNIWSYCNDTRRKNADVASVYVDGGRKENKIQPNERFTLKKGSCLFLRPPMEKRDDKWMHELEFRVVELVELTEETASVKLEESEVAEYVVEDVEEGNTTTTIPCNVVLTQQHFSNEQLLQAFGLTDNEVFANTISAMGFSPLRNQNHSPFQEDGGDLMEFSP